MENSETEDYILDLDRIVATNNCQDISADPKLPSSDHSSNDEPRTVGYNDYFSSNDVVSLRRYQPELCVFLTMCPTNRL